MLPPKSTIDVLITGGGPGNTQPSFGVRWRYALFKQLCRWNRNYRLVPKVGTRD